MHLQGKQPQVGETINDQIAKHITVTQEGLEVQFTPMLMDQYGLLSKAVFVAIIEEAVRIHLRKTKKLEILIESLYIIYLKAVQIESDIDVQCDMLNVGRNFAKLEVTMTSKNQKVAKAMIMCQLID